MQEGPAWLGIGAQRSGTTWFTDLLLQHPKVRLSKQRKKELHLLYRTMNRRFDKDAYLQLFDVKGYPGEFTPFYMRALWVPEVARQVVSPRTPIIVLLRDPLDRFESTMRMTRQPGKQRKSTKRMVRWRTTDAQWAGMYATQLDVWAASFDRDQFVVIQYEALKKDPQAAVNLVWGRMGLDPVELQQSDTPSRTLTQGVVDWKWRRGLKESLQLAYRPEVDRLAATWGIDTSLWRNF